MRRRRVFWWFKWSGTLACALLAAAFFVSAWLSLHVGVMRLIPYEPTSPRAPLMNVIHPRINVWFERGAVTILQSGSLWPDRESRNEFIWDFTFEAVPFAPSLDLSLESAVDISNYAGRNRAVISLGIPFAALLLPTLVCWRLDRRIPPGHCRRCRYDLTGNTSGRCPECGTESKAARIE